MHETLPASQTDPLVLQEGFPLSIVIVSWNTCALLGDLLESLSVYASSAEVIVVDNGSSDGSPSTVEHEFPNVVLIRNAANLGYARANNQGMRRARGRYLLLLGSDTRVIDGSLHAMVRFLDDHPGVGAVSCRLLNPDGTPQRSCRRFPTLWDAVATYLSLESLTTRYNLRGFDYYRTQAVDQPAATCLMLRRSVVDGVGLFEERYSILYNDVDLCRRIRGAGWEIMFLGDAEIIHHGSKSTTQAPPSVRVEMYRNILEYFERSVGRHARVLLLPILLVRLLVVTRSLKAFQLLRRTGEGELT